VLLLKRSDRYPWTHPLTKRASGFAKTEQETHDTCALSSLPQGEMMYLAEAWMSEAVDRNFHSRSKDFLGVRTTTTAPHNLCLSPFFCSTPTLDNCLLSKRHHKPSSADSDAAANAATLHRLTEPKKPRLGPGAPSSIPQEYPLD
jgi:hypothetical protein